jgi:hypothetical protein
METRRTPILEREAPSEAFGKHELVPNELITSAELAECTCPEACERDHDRD